MKISVVIPFTDDDKRLKELESSFNGCEVIYVDENPKGSNFLPHARSSIADCLNAGIKKSTGDYIVVNPTGERVPLPTADIMQAGDQDRELNLKSAVEGGNNAMLIISRKVVETLPYLFEDYYNDCLNYRFVLNALAHGLSVKEYEAKADRVDESKISRMRKVYFSPNEGDLTCVIAFCNEKEELARTCSSIRYTSKGVKILLIDDLSDDGYDYEKIAETYNCEYIRCRAKLGSAGGKHKGAFNVKTPYFCFFDAHMRVYDDDWDVKLIDYLKKEPKSIISSRTMYLKESNGEIVNESGDDLRSYCCRITMAQGEELDPKWTDKLIDDSDSELSPVSCVLGACYATTKEWWDYIRGFEGLKIYGMEETYMSIKTWLLGGKCYVTKNWGTGHIYRTRNACAVDASFLHSNRAFVQLIFLNTIYGDNMRRRVGERLYQRALNQLDRNKAAEIREYIKSHEVHDIIWFFQNINSKVE